MSLPTQEQFEELKKRKEEMERKKMLEKQVSKAQESGIWLPLWGSFEHRGLPMLPRAPVWLYTRTLAPSSFHLSSVLASLSSVDIRIVCFLCKSYFSFRGATGFLLSRILWRLAVLLLLQVAEDPNIRKFFVGHFGICNIQCNTV